VFWFGDVDWSVKVCSGVGECELECEGVFWFGDVDWSVKVCSGLGMCTGV
jgi:hypothetical protein